MSLEIMTSMLTCGGITIEMASQVAVYADKDLTERWNDLGIGKRDVKGRRLREFATLVGTVQSQIEKGVTNA
jgi:hypothetical protein